MLVAVSIGFGEILVCPKCGHEVEQGSVACSHCYARIVSKNQDPKPPAELPGAASDDEFDGSGKLKFLGLNTVKDEVRLGKQYQAKKDVDIARCLFRNAKALERITEQGDNRARRKAIEKMIAGTCSPSDIVRQICPVCGGTKKGIITFGTLRGETTTKERSGIRCPRCLGRRYVNKTITMAQWKDAEKRADKRFALIQEARGFAAIGNAWIPEKLVEKITVQQKAALIQGIAVGCEKCDGTGQVDCRKCKGLGEILCKARGCRLGMVTIERDGHIVKTTTFRTEKCRVCGGKGSTPCLECRTTGRSQCSKCDGSGLRELCSKCDGLGVVDCRRCKGEGTYKDAPCPLCKGEKQTLCPTCKGEGRKR